MGDGILRLWFTPAFVATERIMTGVNPFIVPAAAQWLQ
jgi:hypothetical protein